jgi:hypothetical protein
MPNYRNAFKGSVQSTNLVFPGQFNNQCGGPKKAGLPGTVNRPYGFPIALKVAGTRNTLYDVTTSSGKIIRGLRFTFHPHKAQRPIWSTKTPNPYFSIPGRGTKGGPTTNGCAL